MANFFTAVASWLAIHWRILVIATFLAALASFRRVFETEEARARRLERNREKQIRALADKIANYGHNVHERYPTGDVVVGQHDLAEQFRKTPDAIMKALNLLLAEHKIQPASMAGYWKLNA
jgi:biopolymer transport protein ExbB/TolQ